MKKLLVSAGEAKKLIAKSGSPLYVYRKSIIEDRYRGLVDAITYPKKRVYYACKANANIEILKHLKKLGASIECVSRGEVERAFKVGFPPARISFTSTNIPREELAWLMKKGVHVYLDSLTQLQWWGEMKPHSDVSIRLNLGYGAGAHRHLITGGSDSKFGIYHADIPKLQAISKRHDLRIVGILQHIGTSINSPAAFTKAMDLVLHVAPQFPDLQFLDFGGGFGIPYVPDEKPLDVRELGKKLSVRFEKFCMAYGRSLELRIEPGRYIVAEAGAMLVRVMDVKRNPGNTFVGVDSGFSHLIRPILYDAYHHVFNLTNPKGRPQKVHIVGNLCESADFFAKNRTLPQARIGDLLLFADAGAYGYAMASDYNLRPKPQEVVIN